METKRVVRRKHSAELRAEVVQACRQPGSSVAAIALRNGLNANLIHRWRRLERRPVEGGVGDHVSVNVGAGAGFVPLQLPMQAIPAATADIRMELQRGASTVTVSWPAQCAGECGSWLREWLR